MSEKQPKNGQKWSRLRATFVNLPQNEELAVSWATWLKTKFEVHMQPPIFCGFQPLELPNETPRPRYLGSLGGGGGQPRPRTVGANGGPTRVPGAKKKIFSKDVPPPRGLLKQVFLAPFEPVVTCFGPWKIPKCLENGPFWDQNGVENGSKAFFSTSDATPPGRPKQVTLAPFEPVVTHFRQWKIPRCLENGPFCDQKMGQTWVQNVFFQR